MSGKLTKAQREFLEIVAGPGSVSISQFPMVSGMRASTASMLRNRCYAAGLVHEWRRYNDPIEITDAGRLALKQAEGSK